MKAIVRTTAAAKQLDALPEEIAASIEEAVALYAVAGLGDVSGCAAGMGSGCGSAGIESSSRMTE